MGSTLVRQKHTSPKMFMVQHVDENDPFVMYARSLHDYTLKLWTESIRLSEERSRGRAIAKTSKRKGNGQCAVGGAQTMNAAA